MNKILEKLSEVSSATLIMGYIYKKIADIYIKCDQFIKKLNWNKINYYVKEVIDKYLKAAE